MKKHHVGVLVEKNSFVDDGDGVVSFPKNLSITDNSEQRNGTKYDIKSMDLSEYKGQVTADHTDMLQTLIAKVEGVKKVGNKVVIEKIRYAINENPLARLAYNLLVAGYSTDFSIETYGPMPDDDGIYHDAKLIGLSQVVVGNNRNATVNQVVLNSIEQSKEDGLDTKELEATYLNEFKVSQNHSEKDPTKVNNNDKGKESNEMKFVTIKNARTFTVPVTYKNAAGDEVTVDLAANSTLDISEDQKDAVEKQINEAVDTEAEEKAKKEAEEKAAKEKKEAEEAANALGEKQANAIAAAVKAAMAPVQDELKEVKNAFSKTAEAPKFTKQENSTDVKDMSYKERHGKQINAAYEWKALGRLESAQVLNQINEFNLEALKKEGKVENSMTIADFGSFVISPELLTEIQGCRNDYTALIDATDWQETLSLEFGWLKRQGDIDMQSVEFCDDGANGNLKPISEYTAEPQVSKLEELAAVTPVCNAATRFLAADMIGDIAKGYRNDYDRKRAQLILARLEQAVEANGNSVTYDTNPGVNALTSWVDTWAEIATCTPNGTFIFSTRTYAEVMRRAVQAGVNGPLSNIFISGNVPTIFGRPFIVLPDDLMPALDTAGTVTVNVDGETVTINHAVFYVDLQNFTGRTSGGLQYDLSTEASYEVQGQTKSAFQRNELLLRGSFFRGGAILDDSQVAGLLAPGVS